MWENGSWNLFETDNPGKDFCHTGRQTKAYYSDTSIVLVCPVPPSGGNPIQEVYIFALPSRVGTNEALIQLNQRSKNDGVFFLESNFSRA